jgi:uncharacterized protein (TIGR04255 family)
MIKLPKEISPNPLLSSVVEIRFSTTIKNEELLKTVFPILSGDFPLIKYSDVPKNLKGIGERLKYNPDFIFSNNDYSVSIGTNVLLFENLGNYHLWSSYFSLIKKVVSEINKVEIVQMVERVGVRYISLFDSTNKIKDITTLDFTLGYKNAEQQNDFFQTELNKDQVRLVLRIAQNGNVIKGNDTVKGLFIDIDASKIQELPDKFNESLLNEIDILHTEEKIFFYSLLKKEFLESLNPIY